MIINLSVMVYQKGNRVLEKKNKQQKILILTNHSYMLWQFRRELIQELMKSNQVVLAMPFVGHEKDFSALGVRCIQIEMERRSINPVKDMKLISCYSRIISREKPDKVITYSIKPNIYGGILCRLKKIPYYTNVQGLGTAFQRKGFRYLASLLYRIGIKNARAVIFENNENAAYFLRHHITKKEKIHVLHGAGVNLEYFSYQLQPVHDKIHFLYLGRIMREKGIDEIFSAIRSLHRDGFEFMLDLVGFCEDEYAKEIDVLTKEEFIKFHGFQIDPRPFYREADCILMPSYHEGMSNVNLEAAATGRCVITTDIPGCREAVDHGKTGILVRPGSSESLYKGMRTFLKLSPEKREQFGICARKKMEREFDRDMIVKETIEIIQENRLCHR